MSEEQELSSGMVVIAHADDAEYGCSGTVAKLCAEGWDMTYVLCTDGSKGSSDREISEKELSKIRRVEQIEAGRVLGLKDVSFLDYPDSYLEPTLEVRRDICARDSQTQAGRSHLPVPVEGSGRRLGRGASGPHGCRRGGVSGCIPDGARPHDLPRTAGRRIRASQGRRGVDNGTSRPGHLR